MTTATALTCKHCGATGNKGGTAFKNKGALALHEKIHCTKKPAHAGDIKKDCCANPSIRLLRQTDQRELAVMHQGYKKVCTNCEWCTK